MMAGLTVGATNTEVQRTEFEEAPGIGFTYEPGDFNGLALQINVLAKDPQKLLECRRRSFELARSRFNWETESQKILSIVGEMKKRRGAY